MMFDINSHGIEDAQMKLLLEQVAPAGPSLPFWIFIVLATIVIVSLLLRFLLWKRPERAITLPSPERATSQKTVLKQMLPKSGAKKNEVKKVDRLVDKYLKEDERLIVEALRKRQGKTKQGTLQVVTNFSKAHLSRLLKELEDRGIVQKQRSGRKNLVFLKERV